MALKDLLPGKKKKSKEYYWALVIEPGWVQAGVWCIDEDQTQVITISPPTPWELEEELIAASDTALSAAIQDFPEDLKEPSKTVFGVNSSWVSKGQIKKEHLEKIKKICAKLSLEPVGFVVLPEAIAHLMRSEEGSPLNAVVFGVAKDSIEIAVFALGKLAGNAEVARSISVVDDAVEGLSRFVKTEPFPSRFILYDGKEGELEEARQALLKADWDNFGRIKFLHTPKIEMISADRKVHAVALAGASELADVRSVSFLKEGKKEETEEDRKIPPEPEIKSISPKDLGFAIGKDIATTLTKPKVEPDKAGIQGTMTPTTPQISDKQVPDEDQPPKEGLKEIKKSIKFPKPSMFNTIVMQFKKMIGKIAGIAGLIKKPSIDKKSGRSPFIYGALFLVMVVIIGFLAWWFYPKAQVTVYVSPKKLDEKVSITIDPNITGSIDSIIAGEVLSTTVSGDKTRSTTGVKTIGDKATGEVTIYRVGSQVTLASGTKLFGPGSLEFTLDSDIQLASGSAGSPGTTKTNVTAADIGAQHNLAQGTTFSVGNYSTSEIEAKNESSFSGGSSREINAVSQEDQDVLEEELEEELTENAKGKLKEGIGSNKFFVEESLSATKTSIDFSNKVGDEASTLKLSLTLDAQVLVVENDALINLAADALKDKIPQGFVLRDDQIDIEFEYENEEDEKYEFSAFVEANLLPEIDPYEIEKKIIGKYPPLVEDYFKNEIPGFVRAEISFNKPRFPGRLGTLPHRPSNLEVVISAEK